MQRLPRSGDTGTLEALDWDQVLDILSRIVTEVHNGARHGSASLGIDLSWDTEMIPLTAAEVKARLMADEPRLSYLITVRTRMLRDGELELVARRLRDFFEAAVRGEIRRPVGAERSQGQRRLSPHTQHARLLEGSRSRFGEGGCG